MWVAVVCAVLLTQRFFVDVRLSRGDLGTMAAVAGLSVFLVGKLLGRIRPAPHVGWSATLADIEFGLLMLVSLYAVLQLTGGARSPLHPLTYAAVAFATSFHRTSVGLSLALAALVLEGALFVASPRAPEDRTLLLAHAAFMAFFAVLSLVFLKSEVFRLRKEHETRVRAEIARLHEEARDFRVISTSLSAESRTRNRKEEEEKLNQGAVENIHQGLYFLIETLKKVLGLQTCIVLWLDEAGERLKIRELVSDSILVAEQH